MSDPPTNGRSNPTFAALFCMPNVASAAVNAANGFPGLGRLELQLANNEVLP
jgi:hypothetical protein